MKKYVFILLTLVAGHSVLGQCGCSSQTLLRRSLNRFKMGDMLLDKDNIAKIQGFKNHNPNGTRWPNNTVLYDFDVNFPPDKKDLVRESVTELGYDLEGCVIFEESTRAHFVRISAEASGCWSHIGCTNKPFQSMNLQPSECLKKHIIKHEFIHALGFFHTHMRRDRDDYIDIKWDNIATSVCEQFGKCNGCEPYGPYETTSIMHYESTLFGCTINATVMTKKGGGIIGINLNTTPNDLQMIRSLYQC